MDTIKQMIDCLEEQAITEFNTKMSYIRDIFNRKKYVGIEDSKLKKDPYYFNDEFDILYSMDINQLRSLDIFYHGVCTQINAPFRHEGDE